jgi:(S)-2-hydroxyglutarate dehydrogenase
VINAGGLYADVIAKQFNFGTRYTIWPFKGSYLITNQEGMRRIPEARCVIYPVPPLEGNYFLGIHTTLTVDGALKIGPSVKILLYF